jgi:predicted DNA-binding protein
MDKEASRNVLKAVLQEHPELLNELVPDRESGLKAVVTTIRTTEVLMERVDALVQKLSGTKHLKHRGKLSRSEVIRGALERGVAELEKLV